MLLVPFRSETPLLLQIELTDVEQFGCHLWERYGTQGIQKGWREKGLQDIKPGTCACSKMFVQSRLDHRLVRRK